MQEAWSAGSHADVALREWGDEWTVYVGSTGHTHLLSASAGKLLSKLRQSGEPMTPAALLCVLGEPAPFLADEATDDPAARESMLRAILLELERIGLATMRSP
jgi:PqqD family protein of HPr-rel-A system